MGVRGNSGFLDVDKRFGDGTISGNTKGTISVDQQFLERTHGRMAPIITGTVTGSTQIGFGTTDSENSPIRGFYDFSWSGLIYTQPEIGTMKTITGIGFDVSSFTTRQGQDFNDIRVFCGHYTSDTFATTSPNEDISAYVGISNWTQCTNNGYVWFPNTLGVNVSERIIFDTPFVYNGIDRLMIKLESREGDYLAQPRVVWDSATDTASVAYDRQDNTYPTGTGIRTTIKPNIVIYYEE